MFSPLSRIRRAAEEVVSRQADVQRQHQIEQARKVLDEHHQRRHAGEAEAVAEAKAKLSQEGDAARFRQHMDYLYSGVEDDSREDIGNGEHVEVQSKSWLPWSWIMDMGCGECCQPPGKKDGALSR